MTRIIIAAGLLCMAGTAQAETVTFTFGGGGYPITSDFTITGFNGALGTLTQAVLNTSGTTTVTVRPTGMYAPTAQYGFSSSQGIYQKNGPATFGGNSLSGSGTVAYTNPNGPNPDFTYVFPLTGSGSTTYSTAVQLARFINTDISAYFLVDQPGGTLTANGTFLPYDFVSATSSASGSITYTYTPFAGTVPEPSGWATMIGGLGLAGAAARRRRSRLAPV